MSKLSVDASIIAQTAAKVAADIIASPNTDAGLEDFADLQALVFGSTLSVIGFDSLEELVEAEVVGSRKGGFKGGSGGGGGQADDHGAGVVIKFGKHNGKTIAEVYGLGEEGQGYIEWLAESANSAFLKGKAKEYLASVA